MAGIDFTREYLDLVLLVRASSIVDGAEVVHRWSGPAEAAHSGVAVRGAEGDGELYMYESRIALAEDEISAGGLDEHVQILGQLTVGVVTVEGEVTHDAANRGRWSGRSVVAWAYDRLSGATQEIFRGVASAGPTALTEDGFRLVARDEIAGREAVWPMTQLPTDRTEWTHDDPVVAGTLVHSLHPNENSSALIYFIRPPDRGRFAGPTFAGVSGGAHAWIEGVPYGIGAFNGAAAAPDQLFLHLGPMQPLFVDFVAWEEVSSSTLSMFDPSGGGAGSISTFYNHNPAAGPVGLCCSLDQIGTFDYTSNGWDEEPYPRVFVRVVAGSVGISTAAKYEGGLFEPINSAGTARNLDSEIIEDAFDLAGMTSFLHPADLVTFASTGPQGALSGTGWRRFRGRVPMQVSKKPMSLREGLGSLMASVQSDLVIAFDPTDGKRKFSPRRRRPTPVSDTPDHIVYPHSFVTGHGVESLGWRLDDEAKRRYGTRITVEMPSRIEPYRPASFDLAESDIQHEEEATVIHDNATEDALVGYAIERDAKIKHWRPHTDNGIEDSGQFEGSSRAQRQIRITSTLGHFALGWELLDLVGFEVTTLRHHGPGHIRNVRRDWLRQRATVETWHLEFATESVGVDEG